MHWGASMDSKSIRHDPSYSSAQPSVAVHATKHSAHQRSLDGLRISGHGFAGLAHAAQCHAAGMMHRQTVARDALRQAPSHHGGRRRPISTLAHGPRGSLPR